MKSIRIATLAALAAASTLTACTTVKEEVKPTVVVNAPPPPKEPSSRERFDKAVADFDAGRFDDARAGFLKVADRVPGNLVVWFDVGVVSEKLGLLADAQKAFEAAHKLDPRHKPTLLNLGKIYRLQDKFTEAIALYETALKDPANEYDVELNNNLTVSYRLAKQYAKAESTARKVLSRTKDNPDAYKNLALIYFDQGNYRLAEFISGNAKKLDDKDPGVYNNLGLIYLKLDERRLALAQFQKATTLNKDFAAGLFNIGAMALSYRDYDGAEKVLARATQLDPTSYESFLAYAWALDGQKGRDPKKGVAAGQAFEKVLSLRDGQTDAICGAGWAYAQEKTVWDKALSYLEKCKGLSSTNAQDQQLIDSKIKGIVAMQKSGQPAAQPEPKEKPKAQPKAGGASMLDKVSDEAAAKEGQGSDAPAPAPDDGNPAAPKAPETKAPEAPKP